MNKSFAAAAALVLFSSLLVPAEAAASVLISEMCDPQLNYTTDRFIEIYNAGSEAIDLTGWSLAAVGNGGVIFTWALSGPIDPGEALVAGDATTTIPFPVDFPDEAWSTSNGLWNGKIGDGAKLLDGASTVIDYAVVDATRFENKDYVRNYGVTEPRTSFDPGEWTATPVDYPTEGSPGTHETVPPIPGPAVFGLVTDPAAPLAAETVHIEVGVSDTVAIASVLLRWGTALGSLTNTIPMSFLSGVTYRTDDPIPAQPEGIVVYYEVEAENTLGGVTATDVASYSLPYVLTIAEIQGGVAASPYDGDAVITHGVVTARYAQYFTMQDGGGAWSGIWVESGAAPLPGDSVTVRGFVSENRNATDAGNTLLAGASVLTTTPGAAVPEAVSLSTVSAPSEEYEGVRVRVASADCTGPHLGAGVWQVDDGSGPCLVDDLGYPYEPTLGTTYDVAGPLRYSDGSFKIEPRDSGDVVWVGDDAAPILTYANQSSDTTILVTFSEDVEETTAETPGSYVIPGLDVLGASREFAQPDQVTLTVTAMTPQEYTITVSGVEDLYGNAASGTSVAFTYVDVSPPAGYYAAAEGLAGEALKTALHEIIDDHVACGYEYAWTAYYTTDDKPNGKVWDIYSDIPGGTPPYEYDFGVDEGGIGGAEGTGYTREHSWPKSWFGGEVSPMYSDLFALYPCDAHVNGNRGVYPYGEVDSPEWTSLNGSKRGVNVSPGYTGIVFEPIDAFKGDIARTYLYMSARYYGEDASWPGSDMTDGAELRPWAADMLLRWHNDDPVSQKERDRNAAIYAIQQNRNPFIDRPEFVPLLFVSTGVSGSGPAAPFALRPNAPNPFNPLTTIRFSLPARALVRIRVHDAAGRLVSELLSGACSPGEHEIAWDGTSSRGEAVGSGVYFYTLEAGEKRASGKMVLLR